MRIGYYDERDERRFIIAVAVMAARSPGEAGTVKGDAEYAVTAADALLEELER